MIKDIEPLRALEARGYLRSYRHPTEPLTGWNYTARTQFERLWTPETMLCRGLILDDGGNVVARPLSKFFNLEEYSGPLPDEPSVVYEKLDGCWPSQTVLNLWNGGTVTIGEVVKERLTPTLVGMDENGDLVPCEISAHFDNGVKHSWLAITTSAPSCRGAGSRSTRCGGNVLRVTPNHHLYLNGAYQPAATARVGDKLVSLEVVPNSSVLHVIESSLLGDGSIMANGNGWRYHEPYKADHAEYVEHVRQWLGNCAWARSNTASGYGTTMVWAGSKTYRNLQDLRLKWYPEGKKMVPEDLSWMDDFTVAKWYMDDGSLAHHNGQEDRALFATNSFDEASVRRLAGRLNEMYGVSCGVYRSKGWCLRVNAGRNGEIERFWSAITPNVVPSMRYKVPEAFRNVGYKCRDGGSEVIRPLDAEITAVASHRFPRGEGRAGYDIETTTHNYFAKGVLVHNSLFVVARYGDAIISGTRGSFVGRQAILGRELLWGTYRVEEWGSRIVSGVTYCFELIEPSNRIVVDYGERRELILLAVIDNATGRDVGIEDGTLPMPTVAVYPGLGADPGALITHERPNAEGFVIHFTGPSNLRLKVKFAEYKRLHRILTGINERDVWDALRQDNAAELGRLLERVPDEFYRWVQSIMARLRDAYDAIERRCRDDFMRITALIPPASDAAVRKAFAAEAVTCAYPPVLFALWDRKPYADIIWRAVRPEAGRPYREDES